MLLIIISQFKYNKKYKFFNNSINLSPVNNNKLSFVNNVNNNLILQNINRYKNYYTIFHNLHNNLILHNFIYKNILLHFFKEGIEQSLVKDWWNNHQSSLTSCINSNINNSSSNISFTNIKSNYSIYKKKKYSNNNNINTSLNKSLKKYSNNKINTSFNEKGHWFIYQSELSSYSKNRVKQHSTSSLYIYKKKNRILNKSFLNKKKFSNNLSKRSHKSFLHKKKFSNNLFKKSSKLIKNNKLFTQTFSTNLVESNIKNSLKNFIINDIDLTLLTTNFIINNNEYTIGSAISKGAEGIILPISINQPPSYILKLSKHPYNTKYDVYKEANIIKYFSDNKLGPHFYNVLIDESNKKYGFILLRYKYDLYDYLYSINHFSHINNLNIKIHNLFIKLLNLGFVYGDVKLKNLLVDSSYNIVIGDIDDTYCSKYNDNTSIYTSTPNEFPNLTYNTFLKKHFLSINDVFLFLAKTTLFLESYKLFKISNNIDLPPLFYDYFFNFPKINQLKTFFTDFCNFGEKMSHPLYKNICLPHNSLHNMFRYINNVLIHININNDSSYKKPNLLLGFIYDMSPIDTLNDLQKIQNYILLL